MRLCAAREPCSNVAHRVASIAPQCHHSDAPALQANRGSGMGAVREGSPARAGRMSVPGCCGWAIHVRSNQGPSHSLAGWVTSARLSHYRLRCEQSRSRERRESRVGSGRSIRRARLTHQARLSGDSSAVAKMAGACRPLRSAPTGQLRRYASNHRRCIARVGPRDAKRGGVADGGTGKKAAGTRRDGYDRTQTPRVREERRTRRGGQMRGRPWRLIRGARAQIRGRDQPHDGRAHGRRGLRRAIPFAAQLGGSCHRPRRRWQGIASIIASAQEEVRRCALRSCVCGGVAGGWGWTGRVGLVVPAAEMSSSACGGRLSSSDIVKTV